MKIWEKYGKVILIGIVVVVGVIVALYLHNAQSIKPKAPTPPSTTTESDSLIPTKAPEEQICSLTIRCDTVLGNMDQLKPEKQSLIPADGILFRAEEIEFVAGETAFDVLKRIMQENKMHMAFSQSAEFGAYVEGIANLYQQDCGALSGWLCQVNGEMLSVGASQYELAAGDQVEWAYTCDGGADLDTNA